MEELLLRLAEFGGYLNTAMWDEVDDPSLIANTSIVLLCRLDLEGPLRPNQISELEHMTTGGVSKLIDRMEQAGLVERRRGVLATDRRAVLVVITKKGRELVRRLAGVLTKRMGETEILLKELNRLVGDADSG